MFLFRTSETLKQSTSILNIWRHFSIKLTHEAMKAFELLGISTSSTPEECRRAYLNLALRIHPDVRSELTDTSNDHNSNNNNNDFQKRTNVEFHQLHKAYTLAYEICLDNHESDNDYILEQLDNDIQEFPHKAPQPVHVDYISSTAEEQIQRAMNHGESNNLSGQGRPIDYEKNLHVFGNLTDKRLNQLMANQGFLPKWVLLNKEVNSRWNIAIDKLNSIHNVESNLHSSIWSEACKDFEEEVKELNRLLDQYNLLVPSHQMQRFHLNSKTATDQLMKAKQSHTNEQNKRDPTTTQNESKDDVRQTENSNQSLWDPRYMAEVMRDFYRELARSCASILRGFKYHK
ncbi:unnamed protein product [Schistosoma margrebowiei]|uniref:J domain-containing protein n=1 Tax=Schistosoma margrebowiei TaxID=48269 RepID=A0AA84Z4C0_9TREM|nr:unnamed protein product [Schistosoma margrebowiei]